MTAACPLPCELVLSSGHVVLLDPEDYAWASRHRWHLSAGGYPARNVKRDGCWTVVYLHRLVSGASPGESVDHRDRNRLNATRGNLRLATQLQNCRNKSPNRRRGHSRFKGVSFYKRTGRWVAYICAGPPKKNGEAAQIHLGCFRSEEDAARAYDAAAIRHFGEFAALNFPLAPIDGDPQRSAPELYAEPVARSGGAS